MLKLLEHIRNKDMVGQIKEYIKTTDLPLHGSVFIIRVQEDWELCQTMADAAFWLKIEIVIKQQAIKHQEVH